MTISTLQKIKSLVIQGATLVGMRPTQSPSEADDPAEFEALANTLWPSNGLSAKTPLRVHSGVTIEDALRRMGVDPDLRFHGATPEADLRFQHRRLDDGSEAYFIANLGQSAEHVNADFRVQNLGAEIWDADTGSIEGLISEVVGNLIRVDLQLKPGEARFVVFRHHSKKPAQAFAIENRQLIDTSWDISLESVNHKHFVTRMPKLMSWAEAEDPKLKYFSGTATYRAGFELSASCQARCYLDLGDVRDLAGVALNGQLFSTLWKPPYRVDASGVLKKGWNSIEIKVTNPWANHLIGEARAGAEQQKLPAAHPYNANAALRASGLLGPVTIEYEGKSAR